MPKSVPARPSRVHQSPLCTLHSALCTRSAFSLIELMVTVGLLSFIVLGLMAMFHQTQRAFRSSMTQTDVLEGGRALTDLMTRELEQMMPAQMPGTTNFLSELALPYRLNKTSFQPAISLQDLPGNPTPPLQVRTNCLHNFFFLTRENQQWTGIGYLLGNPGSGVATLYRFQAKTNAVYYSSAVSNLIVQFDDAARLLYNNNIVNTNHLRRIADNIVHLRITTFDPTGTLIVPTNIVRNTWVQTNLYLPELEYFFQSNAVPATVELEIGLLENKTLDRLRSIPVPDAQRNYLSNHAAQVHLFRQRIPVRNVDFSAYQ